MTHSPSCAEGGACEKAHQEAPQGRLPTPPLGAQEVMACYHPVPFQQLTRERLDKDNRPETIRGDVKINPPINTETGYLPCGTCLGCKAARATSWAYRCMHEASLYDHNRFITLTYDDDHLPPNGWLNLRDVQLWMKRLRKAIPTKIRYFLTGEYGSNTGRPHYHALLFNCRFPDEKPAGKLILSATADEKWGMGEVILVLMLFLMQALTLHFKL